MIFARSYMLMLIGLMLMVLCILFSFFIPFIIVLMFMIIGVILILMSLLLIHFRAMDSTLIHLLDDPKRSKIHWLYVYGDRDIIVTPAMRKLERHSFSKKLDQQIQDFQTYRFAGHAIRIVPEGVGHSVDLGLCLYASFAKRVWNVKSLHELRKFITRKKEKLPQEKETEISTYQKRKEETT